MSSVTSLADGVRWWAETRSLALTLVSLMMVDGGWVIRREMCRFATGGQRVGKAWWCRGQTILAVRPCVLLLIIHIVGRRHSDLQKTAAAELDETKHQDGLATGRIGLLQPVQTDGTRGSIASWQPVRLFWPARCQLSYHHHQPILYTKF